jgi:hypothetical protein
VRVRLVVVGWVLVGLAVSVEVVGSEAVVEGFAAAAVVGQGVVEHGCPSSVEAFVSCSGQVDAELAAGLESADDAGEARSDKVSLVLDSVELVVLLLDHSYRLHRSQPAYVAEAV